MPCTVAAGNQAMWRAGIDHETYARVAGIWMFRQQAVRAADERPVRDRLGDGAFRVTGVSVDGS